MNLLTQTTFVRILAALNQLPSQGGKWFLPLILLCATAITAPAWLMPFSKDRIEAEGKNCVHGFMGNFGEDGIFYAGKTSELNEHLRALEANERNSEKTIIIHPGAMVLPGYLKPEHETSVDWLLSRRPNPPVESKIKLYKGPLPSTFRVQIDIWLGGNIKLDELKIPQDFEVRSSNELENFVAHHEQQSKQMESPEEKNKATDPSKE